MCNFTSLFSLFIVSPAEDFCFNRLSSCRACYYGATEKKAPKKCKRFVKRKSARTPAKAEKRVKKWGKCVERVYDEVHSITFCEHCSHHAIANVKTHTNTQSSAIVVQFFNGGFLGTFHIMYTRNIIPWDHQ